MNVAVAESRITEVKIIVIEISVFTRFFIFPMLAFNAKALIGPSRGETSMAPITITVLFRKSPARTMIVANIAINTMSLLK